MESSITTEMHVDFTHQHKHQHNDQSAHEHGHKNFSGEHKHSHDHGHRHGKPPRDGKIVSIGHSQHAIKSTAYHAEVLPLADNKIRFNLLIEDADGKFNDFQISESRLAAELSDEGNSKPTRHFFTAIGDAEQASAFELAVPKSMKNADSLLVKLPKVEFGEDMHSFEFTISRAE